MQKVPMTVNGANQLKEELEHLKKIKRPQIIKAIAEARAHGDLKENAEYHAAKEQQSFIEGRINEVEVKLAAAHVIDVTQMGATGKVIFGATVTLINTDTDETISYQIVGEDEADLKASKVSAMSPLARSLISKEEGDEVMVITPAGKIHYIIDGVEYI
ncbi:MAG: Transcription elongation factor GreA [Gammaproteobacteria bacterium]|nr:Transcription elongation factor GreA [Gammaproteobacteria bacterium]